MRVLVYDRNDSPLFEVTPDELYGLVRDEQLDGPRSLTITTTHVLQKNMRVLVCDATGRWHEYVVEGCDEEHGKGNRPIGTYWCSWSMQHDLELTVVSKMPSGGVSTALAAVLSGTKRWTAGTVTKVKTASASMYEMGGWEAVAVMCDAWECEVDDEITVDTAGVVSRSMAALEHVGSATATRRFDYGNDMKSIKRTVDEEPVFARVIPKGMGEETDTGYYGRRIGIESVNGGIPWLENATTAPYLRVPDGEGGYEYPTRYVVNDELDDPADLKAWALANLDEWTAPKVTYGADLCQFQVAGLDANGVQLGDEVQVVDRAFGEDGLRIAARVVSLRINELDPADMALVIGDAPANMATGLTTLAGTLSDVKSTVEVMNGGSMTTADYLSRLVDRLNYAINAQGGYSYLVPGLGMVTYDVPVADPADPVEASAVVEIRGGTVRIADSKNQDGTWQYKTVFTSGHLAADVVTAANITAGYIGSSSGTFIDLDNGIAQFGDTSGIWTQVATDAFNVRQGATDVLATLGASTARIGKSSEYNVAINSNGFAVNKGSQTGLFEILYDYDYDPDGEQRDLMMYLDPRKHSYIRSWVDGGRDPNNGLNYLWIMNGRGLIELSNCGETGKYSYVDLGDGRVTLSNSHQSTWHSASLEEDGTFQVEKLNSDGGIVANGVFTGKSSTIDEDGTAPTSTQYKQFAEVYDKDGTVISHYEVFQQASTSVIGHNFAAVRRTVNGTRTWYQCSMRVAPNGTVSYVIQSPAAFCSALNVGDREESDQSTNVSVANNTQVNICSVTLSAGVWIICGNVQFSSNANGGRLCVLSANSSDASSADQRKHAIRVPADASGPTRLNVSATKSLTASTTYYLKAYQQSGSTLTVTGCISAVRIK